MTDEPKNQFGMPSGEKPEQPEVPGVPPRTERPAGEPVPPEKKPEVRGKEPPKKPVEKRQPSFGRRLLRWLIYALIFFGLGALVVYYFLLIPAQQDLRSARSDLQSATQQVQELEQQNQELQALEERNQTLQEEANQAELHSALLAAQVDVLRARLAVAQEQPAQADVALNNTMGELNRISALLPENQRGIVDDLKERLELARAGLEDNTFAAQSDLEVLFAGLVDLENNLF